MQLVRNLNVQNYRLHLLFRRLVHLSILFRPHHKDIKPRAYAIPISKLRSVPNPSNVIIIAIGKNITSFHVLFLVQQLLICLYPYGGGAGYRPRVQFAVNIYNIIYYTIFYYFCKPLKYKY